MNGVLTKTYLKFFLVLEFVIAFWLPVMALATGLLATPIAISGFFYGNFEGYIAPLLSACGGLGLRGVCQLLAHSINCEIRLPCKKRMILYLVVGIGATIPLPLMFMDESIVLTAFTISPIAVTFHLVFLNRNYFKR